MNILFFKHKTDHCIWHKKLYIPQNIQYPLKSIPTTETKINSNFHHFDPASLKSSIATYTENPPPPNAPDVKSYKAGMESVRYALQLTRVKRKSTLKKNHTQNVHLSDVSKSRVQSAKITSSRVCSGQIISVSGCGRRLGWSCYMSS